MRKINFTSTLACALIAGLLCGCSAMPASQQPRDSTRSEIEQAKDLNTELRAQSERRAYQDRLRTGTR